MNIVLFGSTDITKLIADYLYNNGYTIAALVTTPEVFSISYARERIRNSRYIDFSVWAKERNITILSYENATKTLQDLTDLNISAEFAIVAGWYHIIPNILRIFFTGGCAGFHASLLPNLRGGAPLNWAILAGYKETGVSFFELSDGIDDGLLYDQERFLIEDGDYIQDLIYKSKKGILTILDRTLPEIREGSFSFKAQVGDISYCGQRKPEDSKINWNKPALDIARLVRASSLPYFGAYSFFDDRKITIWKADVSNTIFHASPGQILINDKNVYVACGIQETINLIESDEMDMILKCNHRRFETL